MSGLYEVSSLGHVKALAKLVKHVAKITGAEGTSQRKERTLALVHDSLGYAHVRLARDGKSKLFKVHHLVAAAFLGYDRSSYDRRDMDSLVVTHVNGQKDDNTVTNLEVVSLRELRRRQWGRDAGLGTIVFALSMSTPLYDKMEHARAASRKVAQPMGV